MTIRKLEKAQCQVLIVDDSARFAWHAYQFLGMQLGLRIGSYSRKHLQPPLKDTPHSNGEARPLVSDDGMFATWWVNADQPNWSTDLRAKVDEFAKNKIPWVAVLDVWVPVGRRNEGQAGQSEPGYNASEALDVIVQACSPRDVAQLFDDHVRIVSSYRGGHIGYPLGKPAEYLPIRAKSLEVLRSIRRRHLDTVVTKRLNRISRATNQRDDELSVLVTGAGFEVEPTGVDEAGQGKRVAQSGIRPADELALAAVKGLLNEGAGDANVSPSLSRLERQLGLNAAGGPEKFRTEVQNIGLDRAVDKVLALLKAKPDTFYEDTQPEDKASNYRVEYAFRRSLRDAIENDDFGHLPQTVQAVRVDWDCWLTTNYTKFCDRALALSREARRAGTGNDARSRQAGGRGKTRPNNQAPENHWKIISTPHEANDYLGRVRFSSRNVTDNNTSDERYLFKLHGDIAHIHTMALAGADKEQQSPHAFRVDSISRLYVAAIHYLHDLFATEDGAIYWHIVGHAMNDPLLTNLIAEATLDAITFRPERRICFVLCNGNLSNGKDAMDRVVKELEAQKKRWSMTNELEVHYWNLGWSASQYMARLQLFDRTKGGFLRCLDAVKEDSDTITLA